MTDPLSVVNPDVRKENMSSIRSFLKDSYSNARKNINDGVTFFNDGVTFFKDEFSAFYNKTGTYINAMMLPVNNYVKDLSQIDTELEQQKSSDPAASGHGHLVPIEEALRSPMEENY